MLGLLGVSGCKVSGFGFRVLRDCKGPGICGLKDPGLRVLRRAERLPLAFADGGLSYYTRALSVLHTKNKCIAIYIDSCISTVAYISG